MAGAYCKFCGTRCFLLRTIPDGPQKGWTGHLATCAEGMAHDLKVTGHTHETAINPITDPEAAAAVHAEVKAEREEAAVRDHACPFCAAWPGVRCHLVLIDAGPLEHPHAERVELVKEG
jgi:hypothetical protein